MRAAGPSSRLPILLAVLTLLLAGLGGGVVPAQADLYSAVAAMGKHDYQQAFPQLLALVERRVASEVSRLFQYSTTPLEPILHGLYLYFSELPTSQRVTGLLQALCSGRVLDGEVG